MSFLTKWLRRAAPSVAPQTAAGSAGAVAVPGQRGPSDEVAPTSAYAGFNVLLDTPAEDPALGFDRYAVALVEMITNSRAEFAVGIFGTWGSGKTTLMRAIEQNLRAYDNVVPVWFAAWRYEKEPNLLLPLLDVLREALEKEAGGKKGWAHDAAVAVGHAGQAFLTGLSITANLPGVQAGLDVGRVMETLKVGRKHSRPLSYYHAGFQMLRSAIEGLSASGTRRVVIFIDDLDRCVPPNALQVLESMKLFFDEEGCIFVVGLDQDIADRAVAEKYGGPVIAGVPESAAARSGSDVSIASGPRAAAATRLDLTGPRPGVTGSDYVKKLFQVPFALPGIKPHELPGYLDMIERSADFSEAQRRDFAANVRPHFRSLHGDLPANPREIKLLLNLYTLQLKMLSTRPGTILPNVVLALLCLNFHPDWKPFYEHLATDPGYTQPELLQAIDRDDRPKSVWLAGIEYRLTPELAAYLAGPARPALTETDLRPYISAAESTWSADPRVLEARIVVSRLRRAGTDLVAGQLTLAQAAHKISLDVDRLDILIGRRPAPGWLGAIQRQLRANVGALMNVVRELQTAAKSNDAGFLPRWTETAVPLIKALDEGLLAWHRYVSLGL
jgi:hypothetical protein